jgi:hypothetical protein
MEFTKTDFDLVPVIQFIIVIFTMLKVMELLFPEWFIERPFIKEVGLEVKRASVLEKGEVREDDQQQKCLNEPAPDEGD